MGRFLKYILIALVGFFTLVGLAVVVGIGLVVNELDDARLPGMEAEFDAPDRMLLAVNLGGPLPETEMGGPFTREASLTRMVRALDHAADDPRVIGLIANVSGAQPGLAQAQELRSAVERFREAEKETIAFAESFGAMSGGTAAYYLASAFEEVHLQPSGDLAITGLNLSAPFFGEALAELGVTADFDRRHEYKGAPEQFTRAAPTLPVRDNYEQMLDRFYETVVRGIAGARSISPVEVSTLIDNAPLSAQEALEAGLVDALTYPSDLRRDRPDALDATLVPIDRYLPPEEVIDRLEAAPNVAVVPVIGPILPGRGGAPGFERSETVYGQDLADALTDAAEDPEIAAVLLRIDSPGGAYTGADAVWAALGRVKGQGKPVIAWLGDVTASGGYFIAMAADIIIAQPSSLAGSIGVFSGKFVAEGLLSDLGIRIESYSRGENATIDSPVDRFTVAQRRKLSDMLDRVYADFTAKAAEARGLSEAEIDAVARGRIFAGTDAGANGLIDRIGGYPEALAVLRDKLALAPDADLNLFPYPPPPDPLEALLQALQSGRLFAAMGELSRLLSLLGEAEALLRTPGMVEAPRLDLR
ncbi:MAG: S49 family peptidase [Alphaproteobacteria bacterium]|nr:S49 family peptidase [Alphaproteobacteria bacterium]